MKWISIDDALPSGLVLVWSGGVHRLGLLVGGGETDLFFMDPETDILLDWPSHWAPLPPPPEPGG